MTAGPTAAFEVAASPVFHGLEGAVTETCAISPADLMPGTWDWMPRPLNEAEYRELRDSIAAEGILTPLIIDADGAVLDGNHRLRVARELSLEFVPVRRAAVMDDREREAYVLRLQLGRRNLDPVSRDELIGRLYRLRRATWGGDRRSPQRATIAAGNGDTSERLAREFAVSPRSVRNAAARVDLTGELRHLRDATTAQVLDLRRRLKSLRGAQRAELLALAALSELDLPAMERSIRWLLAGLAPAEAVAAAQRGEEPATSHDMPEPRIATNIAARFERLVDRLNGIVTAALASGISLNDHPWNELDAALQEALASAADEAF